MWKDAPENPNRGKGPKDRKPKAPKAPKAPKGTKAKGAKKSEKTEAEGEDDDPVDSDEEDKDEDWLHMLVSRPLIIYAYIYFLPYERQLLNPMWRSSRPPHYSLVMVILISIPFFDPDAPS